ncbi:glutamine--fructose-6-phosphate transaminase (isomerizing) [Lachnoclostridium sp. Marseille-P6806]|uniref:glutamine--fructose-6-phosphate transaminase (isomerizing) n=1 Tax=Lachnoclostridium sp. Marseille-P6806 TaxID=2364793 RepID=UPI00102F3AB3|nr:glutamine--fructose-6-phosphate transaminase (isomerizing) [Lachnoclostridium sp. Marseille-P6806]
MCGIVGYTGKQQAGPIILEGLAKLEYRGYDSTGMAVHDGTRLHIQKAAGRLGVLENITRGGALMPGFAGIGHTRWATHGVPEEVNAHPHFNKDKTIAVVQNGIIENYIPLRRRMEKKGYAFISETDTEVIAHNLDWYYRKYGGDPVKAIVHTLLRLEGSYAIACMFADHPEEVYAVRRDCPLIVGHSAEGSFAASDATALLKYTRDVYYIGSGTIAALRPEEIGFYNLDEEETEVPLSHIDWDAAAAEKGGYDHFMLKEMYEQPQTVRDTISPRLRDGRIVIDELGLSDEDIRRTEKIYIVACGSAYHAGMTGKYVIEGLARIPVETDLASEFRYRNPIFVKNSLLIVVSQSGETADTLAALRLAKENGVRVLGIVNVVGSTIAREADNVMYTWAGPEIAVATTKAYSAQLCAMYLLGMKFAEARGELAGEALAAMLEDLRRLPDQIELTLNNHELIRRFANRYIAARDIFFIGRGIDYAISLEGSLKLKEISYIHSEAYAAGELKHGTISLMEEGTLVAAVSTQPALYDKMISNMEQVRSRGAFVLAVTNVGNESIDRAADYVIHIPLQLFAYYIACSRGCDVDKPRNLAKSVTVE